MRFENTEAENGAKIRRTKSTQFSTKIWGVKTDPRGPCHGPSLCTQNNSRQDGTMNVPLVNQSIHRKRDFWPACPMQGVPLYSTSRGWLVPRPETRVLVPTEVIDLVDDDSSMGSFDLFNSKSASTDVVVQVNRDSTKPLDTRKRKLVIELADDDSFLETVLKGTHDWETLSDTSDSETSASVVQDENDDSDTVTALIWDGGSLSFLDSFKESEIPTDFCDDDISAIVLQVETEVTADGSDGLLSDELLSFRDSLKEGEMIMDFLNDDISSVVVPQDSNTCTIAPTPVDERNRSASCSFLDHPTGMVSMDDEKPCTLFGVQLNNEACAVVAAPEEEFDLGSSFFALTFNVGFVVPWDNGNDKSTNVMEANAPTTTGHDFSMACFDR